MKNILVTGGSRGIGKYLTLYLAKQGNNLITCARNAERLEELKGVKNIKVEKFDIGDIEKIDYFKRLTISKLGGDIDILILNAALTGLQDDPEYSFRVNHDSQIALIKAFYASLKQKGGRVVFMTSAQAQDILPGLQSYGLAKKKVEDFIFELSQEEDDIQFFCINPGHVATNMQEEAFLYGDKEVKERTSELKRLGKLRDPELVAKIVSKIVLAGKNFNPDTLSYDVVVKQGEIIRISDENVIFESNLL